MPIIEITKEVFEEIGKAVNKNTLEEKDKEIERLKERIEYLERSNNRREDDILELRKENADLVEKFEDKGE